VVLSVDDVIGCDVTLLTSLPVVDDVTGCDVASCGDVTVVCVLNAAVETMTHIHRNTRNTTTEEKLKKK